jgi:hypothetical protein
LADLDPLLPIGAVAVREPWDDDWFFGLDDHSTANQEGLADATEAHHAI